MITRNAALEIEVQPWYQLTQKLKNLGFIFWQGSVPNNGPYTKEAEGSTRFSVIFSPNGLLIIAQTGDSTFQFQEGQIQFTKKFEEDLKVFKQFIFLVQQSLKESP